MVMPHLGFPEIGLILAIILIVFGVGKLPQVGGAIGKGLREFRRGQSGEFEEEEHHYAREKRYEDQAGMGVPVLEWLEYEAKELCHLFASRVDQEM